MSSSSPWAERMPIGPVHGMAIEMCIPYELSSTGQRGIGTTRETPGTMVGTPIPTELTARSRTLRAICQVLHQGLSPSKGSDIRDLRDGTAPIGEEDGRRDG